MSDFDKYASELQSSSSWRNASGIGDSFNAAGAQQTAMNIAAVQNMSTAQLLERYPNTEVITLTLLSNIVGHVPTQNVAVDLGFPNLAPGVSQADGSVNFLDPSDATKYVNVQAASPTTYTQFRNALTSRFRKVLLAKIAVSDPVQYGQSFAPARKTEDGEVYTKQWIMQNFRTEFAQQSNFLTIPFKEWELNMDQGLTIYVMPSQAITISLFCNSNFTLSDHHKMHGHHFHKLGGGK